MLLNVEHLYKYFNGQALLKDINFTVEDRVMTRPPKD